MSEEVWVGEGTSKSGSARLRSTRLIRTQPRMRELPSKKNPTSRTLGSVRQTPTLCMVRAKKAYVTSSGLHSKGVFGLVWFGLLLEVEKGAELTATGYY